MFYHVYVICSEDVVEMLRNAFRLLDKLDRDRPDSGNR